MSETAKLCTKCGTNPRATEAGNNPWCKECRAAYQKSYSDAKAKMTESRGFAAGVTAMRWALARRFESFGRGMFSGLEVADVIRKAPGPGDVDPAVSSRT